MMKRSFYLPSVLPVAVFAVLVVLSAYLLPPEASAARPQNSFAVVSAASYGGTAIAAEEIVAAFGSNLASSTVVANTLPLPTQLGGVSVKVRDSLNVERLAPLFFISPTQINFQIPAGTATGATVLTVVNNNANAATANMPVSSVAPGLFTADASGMGLASANVLRIKADGTQTYEPIGRFDSSLLKFVSLPVDLGPNTDQVFLILYGTGFRNRQNANLVKATIGGVNAEVQFAGPQGNFAGLDQMNVRIPRDAGSGELDVVVSFDGQTSNAVRVALKPPVNQDTTYLASLRPENTAMSPSSGYSTLKLSGDEKSGVIRFNYTNLTTPQVSGHIHGPADPGQNAQILFDLDTATKLTDGSMVWTFTNTAGLSAAQIVQALKAGRLYINIHSSKYPSGEIRGHYGLVNGSQSFTPPAAPPPLPTGTPTPRDAARFLTQATFGPKSTAEITALQSKSFNTWLNEQFALPQATHMAYLDATIGTALDPYQQEMMESFWKQAVTGQDQLRQRVAFALSQIMVVSFNSNLSSEPFGLAGYQDTIAKDVFGNFRQLLEDITLNPAMGRYLDMLQNDKEDAATGKNPNENYAREVLQLFSIGLYKLHPDGSLVLDANGLPIATYDQSVVQGFASVFTGWSYGWFPKTEQNWLYPNAYHNGSQFWRVPMQVWPNHHSTLAKKLLNGVSLPASQTPDKDLKDALDNIFNHANVGPFISRQLIQRLVTSNPSPGYVYRVTQKFNDNGQGVRGDLKAVIRA
ncbi:MAG: DUF1800 family protein, partial [Blastocatellia bacterium]